MTITWAILGVAVVTGLLGGVHCAGMCGGIVSALATGPKAAVKPWPIHLCYNLGRIASYAVAGASGLSARFHHVLAVRNSIRPASIGWY